MNEPAFYVCLSAQCVCLRQVIGQARRNDEPEFKPEVVEEFYAMLRKGGWVQGDQGGWSCGDACPGSPPWMDGIRKLAAEGRLPKQYKIKTINPDDYGTAEVTNL